MEDAEVEGWESFPGYRESVVTMNVMQKPPIKARLAQELNLPQSLIIAKFDTPVYATNYSLRISKNTAYKLEGSYLLRGFSMESYSESLNE